MARHSLSEKDYYHTTHSPPVDGGSDVEVPSSPEDCNTLFSKPHFFQLYSITFPVGSGGENRTVYKLLSERPLIVRVITWKHLPAKPVQALLLDAKPSL
jgi:hypothetical protein